MKIRKFEVQLTSFLLTRLLAYWAIKESLSNNKKDFFCFKDRFFKFRKNYLNYYIHIVVIAIILLGLNKAVAADRYSVANGNWNSTAVWSATSGGAPGASAPVAGDNVFIEGNRTVTITANAACTNVSIAAGSILSTGGFSFTVSGQTTLNGTFNILTSTAGTKTFVGLVTIHNGGVWNNPINEGITFSGGLVNNGTFNSGTGTYTFNTNLQSISGTNPIVFSGTLAITGAITITNTTNVTVSGNLTGSVTGSTWVNAAGSTLTAGNAVLATGTLTATSVGNTVIYNRINTQTVKPTSYHNLTLSGTSTKTTTGVTVNGTFSLEGTAIASVAPTYGTNATLQYNTATSRTAGVEWLSTFNASGGIRIANSGIISVGAAKTINSVLTINPGSKINLGTFTSAAQTMSIGGEGVINGSWGSSSSPATYKDDVYFEPTTGIINIASSICVVPSNPTTTGATICSGNTAVINAVGASSGQRYRWYNASTGGTLLKTSINNTDNTYTTPNLTSTTNYWVAILKPGGCESSRIGVTVTVNPFPNAAGTISGVSTVCQGQSNVGYSVPLITDATTYLWNYSGTGVTITGTTNSVFLTFASNATSGNLTVLGVNGCGNGTVSANFPISVGVVSSAPIASNATACIGNSVVLTASGAGVGFQYKWYDASIGGNLLKTSLDHLDVSFTTPALTTPINYWVSISNASGCESARTLVSVSINNITNWTGAVNSDWNNSANWTCNVPNEFSTVTIPSGLTIYPNLNSGPEAFIKNLTVINGATLTINENYLRISENLNLFGKIDLQGEAQLLQDQSSILNTGSTGIIERDQQGTADNFKYNYWGSPVNTTGTHFTIAGVLRDGTDINNIKLINFGTSWTYADGAVTSPVRLSTYWMYKFANKLINDYYGWEAVGKDGLLKIGEGFTMKGSNTNLTEQYYTFIGKPNNGDISLTLSAGREYLIGNPYPSAIDAKQFIRDNIALENGGNRTTNIIDGNLYFWDHFGGGTHYLKTYEGGYGVFNLTGGTPAIANLIQINNTGNTSSKIPQRFTPVAQGFFVKADMGGDIHFKNSQRTFKKEQTSTSEFIRNTAGVKSNKITNSDEIPRIYLQFISPDGFHRKLLVGIIEYTTSGIDVGYDGILNEINRADMSWKVGNNQLVIQAVPTLSNSLVLPLDLKIDQAGVAKIKLDGIENIPAETELFIKDNLTGVRHPINTNPFEINLATGTYTNRFELGFKTQGTLTVEENETNKQLLTIFTNPQNSTVYITKNQPVTIKEIGIYSILGQQIALHKKEVDLTHKAIPLQGQSGVYMIKVTTNFGVISKKILKL